MLGLEPKSVLLWNSARRRLTKRVLPVNQTEGPYRRDQNPYLPFRRADGLVGSALYWIPVSAFPCGTREKEWLRQFLQAFDKKMKQAMECRVEIFVHRDAIYPDMMEPMLLSLRELNPLPGVMRMYGEPLRKALPPREIERLVTEGKVEALLSMGTDTGWWFVRKNADRQRSLFLGQGGMVNVWLPPDPKTTPPHFRMPEKVLNNPAFAGMDVAGTVQVTYSLADSFLRNSLGVFAPELKSDPQYQGYPFALVLFKSQDIFDVGGDKRKEWLSLAPCYMVESRPDRGILLWGVEEIDELILGVLEDLRKQGSEYPLR